MRGAFTVAALIPLSLMFMLGLLCAAAPARARKEVGGTLNLSGDVEIRVCGVLFMIAAALFSYFVVKAGINFR